MDLIDRQKAIDEINKLEYPSSLVDVKRIIVDLPSAEPERKTARWIHKGGGSFICSECGEMVGLNTYLSERAGEIFLYCPHCGAYMKGELDGKSV